MKRHLLFLTAGIIALLASCSPASVVTGNYTGNVSAYNWVTSSGSGTASITTVNDNTVNIKINSAGTDINFDNVSVSKIEAYGIVVVDFSGSNSVANFNGTYSQAAGINEISLNIDSTSASGYVHFDGSK